MDNVIDKATCIGLLDYSKMYELNLKSLIGWKIVLFLDYLRNHDRDEDETTRQIIADTILFNGSERTLERALMELESKNIISCWRTVGKENHYQIRPSNYWKK